MTMGADCKNDGDLCTVTGPAGGATSFTVTANSLDTTGDQETGTTAVTMRSSQADPVRLTIIPLV